MSLTTACVVHSNVDGLVNIHCIRYLTVVDPLLSTSSTVHTYRHMHLTSASVDFWIVISAENSSSIRKVPVPSDKHIYTG